MSATASSLQFPLSHDQARRVEDAFTGLDASQLQWLSGYAAGLAASGVATAPATAPQADVGETWTILYGSQTGNGEGIASRLADDARARGYTVKLASLADYKPSALKKETLASFIISTHGEGDPPDDAELFHEFLLSAKAPGLEKLRYNVLALGDSSYVNFCQTGREFDARLAELGGERLTSIVECDVDFQDAAGEWAEATFNALPEPANVASVVPQLRAVPDAPVFDRNTPLLAEVQTVQRITGRDSSKSVYHVELSLDDSGLLYAPGDSLAVMPVNPPALVDEVLDVTGIDGDTTVDVDGQTIALREALSTKLEITALSLPFLTAWAAHSNDASLEALAAGDNKEALSDLIDSHQVIDILHQFPASVDGQSLADSLRRLAPRSYSIASSLTANPDEVHLTVAEVAYEAFDRPHWGSASTYLGRRLEEGDRVTVYVETNNRFRLPDNPEAPIIMIGPGTGVAPFRAFVEERAEQEASGRNWLFFGERNFDSDFLYQLEWLRHLKQGSLERLDVAFSRDQAEKIYVQHRIRDNAAELVRWIDDGAHVYVCGDAKHMAPDVHAALRDALVAQRGVDADTAEQALKDLRQQGRYQRDVY
ncbi:MAG: assimilatory sulfite reductase (NADPH) flavoprotein subunit [Pseudomonadota bacterium]